MAIPTVAPIKPTPKVGDTWDVPVRSTRSRVPVRILGFLAGALIALPVLALIAVGPVPFDQVRSALTLPDELRSAALISDTGTTSSVHRIGWWFYREVAATGHQYASVALFKDGGIAAIALEPSGEAMLEIDGQRIGALPASSTGLTVAPDGTKLGVMYIPDYESPAQLPENVTDTEPTLWQIGVFRIPSATFSPAGKGYAPFFMDDANLARAVPAGVTMLTIPTGEMHQLIDEDLV
ncbi:MAG TPA: hypothetical protein VHO23_01825, partial [Candidatus Paceibacterota bacterium]|nr:hypothetical protein [Candidatus Paceibacterota bacterium]